MTFYEELLAELNAAKEASYAAFHKRLLKNDRINVLGVRVPTLRKMAKARKSQIDQLLACPDEYYEVTFVKLQAVALLPYGEFVKYVDKCVPLIDNWATCDSFAPKCIAACKGEFAPFIYKYMRQGTDFKVTEFSQRFALTTLLHFYVEERFVPYIFDRIREDARLDLYYVHMAAAWLIAEVLVKFFDTGVEFLRQNAIDAKTHNKAIQKACESYRLTNEQKNFLKGLKR